MTRGAFSNSESAGVAAKSEQLNTAFPETEQRYQTIFHQSPIGQALVDREGRLLECNHALEEMLGYPADQLIGQTFLRFTHPDDAKLDWDLYTELVEGRRNHYHISKRYFRKDGEIVEARLTVSAIRDSQGKVLFAAGMVEDVTQRRLTERALRESEERFRLLANEAPVMIWMSDLTKGCTWFNQSWLKFVGRTMEEEVGDGWAQNVHSEDLARCLETYTKSFDARLPFQMEYRLQRHDGEYRWIDDHGVPRFSAEGQFHGYVGCCTDRTLQKRAEHDLKVAHEELKRNKERLQEENVYLRQEAGLSLNPGEIVAQSAAMQRVWHQIDQVAGNNSTVLITGETGTGKELVARAIHARSLRADRTMVIVNCAALPGTLIESELFGREKGAYTGALSKQIGRFELADGSTLFLDEIGELPLEVQVKLLRTLQEGEFERLGSPITRKCDVRIIAATNRDLSKEISEGRFREDLYYRINVFPIEIAPLRDRPEDLTALTWAFVNEFETKLCKSFEAIGRSAMDELLRYSWPGNIRELRNVIERAVITSVNGELHFDLPKSATRLPSIIAELGDVRLTLEEVQRRHILSVVERCNWRISGVGGAAEVLGMKPTTLESKMKRLSVTRPHAKQAISRDFGNHD